MSYLDRIDAGNVLARELAQYKNAKDTLILGLPRGGVPVAYAIAVTLHLPLTVFIVRKLGVPQHEELAFGAIASGGIVFKNEALIARLQLKPLQINTVLAAEKAELKRREVRYGLAAAPYVDLAHKRIILVDDGIATGASIQAAVASLKQKQPKEIIVAVPVAPIDAIEELHAQHIKVICPLIPEEFNSVGRWYQNFQQTEDSEVVALLKAAQQNKLSP